MIVDRNCAVCGAQFQVKHWLKQRHCSKFCGDHTSKNKRHGLTQTTEHAIWRQMKQRCYNPRKSDYGQYGAKGIGICDRWLNSFESFYADMGPRPSMDHTVDRVDGTKNYGPDNCRWATRLEQNRNRKGNWTADEDQAIRDAVERGLNFKQMAPSFPNRSEKALVARAYRIGLRSGQPCSNYRGSVRSRVSPPLPSPHL